MKLISIIPIAGLAALGAAEALRNLTDIKVGTLEHQNLTVRGDDYSPDNSPYLRPAGDALWYESMCRGAKLMFATTQYPAKASQFLNHLASTWDSDLRQELALWGYQEGTNDPDRDCNLHAIKPMLDAIGLPSLSAQQGAPNYCFSVIHCDGPAVERDPNGELPQRGNQHYNVNGRRYRVTGAYATIVINPEAGAIFLLRRGSPLSEARSLWGINDRDPVPQDELPALRASSDIIWGFWKRVSGIQLAEIKLFVSMTIMNPETERIIDRALVAKGLDKLPTWPGIEVAVTTESYLAILGSPNGRAVGYFLAQHKAQIGGNRYVRSIHAFLSRAESVLPNLAFHVDWAPNPPPEPPTDPINVLIPPPRQGGKVVGRSDDGKNILREHLLQAEL